jgi:hypothetical protein
MSVMPVPSEAVAGRKHLAICRMGNLKYKMALPFVFDCGVL